MHLTRYPTAAAFLAASGDHLLKAEAENALMLGIAGAIAAMPVPPGRSPYFSVVHDARGPLMAAFSNDPERLGLTRAEDDVAIGAIVDDVIAACPAVRDIGGPEPTAGEFAAMYASRAKRIVQHRLRTRIHRLEAVLDMGPNPPGHLRPAVDRDRPRLTTWVAGFLDEVGDHGHPAEILEERMAADQVFVWDDNGPVSMAGWSGKTPNGVRVNLVFTPPQLRGRGYATATVGALSRQLLGRGNRFCCLYTDLANPTSNKIYARIGYRPVCDAGLYTVVR